MSEKTYVINVKTKLGTIFTVRADSAEELKQNVTEVIVLNIENAVFALEEVLAGVVTPVTSAPVTAANPVDIVTQAVGGTVISTTAPTSAPVAAPAPAPIAQAQTAPICAHGQRTFVDGSKFGKSWKAWMCPQPKDATEKCDPVWVK